MSDILDETARVAMSIPRFGGHAAMRVYIDPGIPDFVANPEPFDSACWTGRGLVKFREPLAENGSRIVTSGNVIFCSPAAYELLKRAALNGGKHE